MKKEVVITVAAVIIISGIIAAWFILRPTPEEQLAQIPAEEAFEMGIRYIEGDETYEKDPEKGFKLLLDAAEKGHDFAAYYAGVCCLTGTGTEKNVPQAVILLKRAAENTSDPRTQRACVALSQLYLGNFGAEYIDYEQGFRYSLQAADAELPIGYNNLAVCYLKGWGCEVDRDKAVELFRIAARNGVTSARQNLRNMGISWEE